MNEYRVRTRSPACEEAIKACVMRDFQIVSRRDKEVLVGYLDQQAGSTDITGGNCAYSAPPLSGLIALG